MACSRARGAARPTSLERKAVTQALLLCSATRFSLAPEFLGLSQGPPSLFSLLYPRLRVSGGWALGRSSAGSLPSFSEICDMLTA